MELGGISLVRDAAWFMSGVSALAASHRVDCRRGQALPSTCTWSYEYAFKPLGPGAMAQGRGRCLH